MSSTEVVKSPLAVVCATVIKVGYEDFVKLMEVFRPRGATVVRGKVRTGVLGKGKEVLILIHGSIAYVHPVEKGEEVVITPDVEVEDLRFCSELGALGL